jgi:hypothetical protein
MTENPPRRRWAPVAAVAAVLLAAVVVGVALGTGLINLAPTAEVDPTPTPASPSGSPDPSTEPSPYASDAPPSLAYEPPPGVLPPTAVVVVNEPLDLRSGALDDADVVTTIEPGRRMRIYGPLIVDGRRWYSLASIDFNDPVYGYVELDPAGDQVSLEPVTCPSGDPSLATLGPLSSWERLACNGDRQIVLKGHEITGFGGYRPGSYAPDWLNGFLGAFAIADPADPSKYVFVRVAPGGPDTTRPQPSTEVGSALLRVTGHFNDAASTTCSVTDLPIAPADDADTADLEPIAAELMCRGEFVVTAFEVADEGTGETPRLADLEVGSVVVPVVEGVTLREDPGTGGARIGILSAGSQNIVVEGPVEADGFAWYRMAAVGLPPASGCITPVVTNPLSCPVWYGWAAAGNPADGSAWFVATAFDCPDPDTQTNAFLSLPYRMPLVCYGSDEITFTAFYPELPDDAGLGGACADPSVGWLYCANLAYDQVWPTETYTGGAVQLFVDPASGVNLPDRGQWLRITGAYDHPDSADCARANQEGIGLYENDGQAVLACRSHLVVTAVEVTSAP